MDQGQRALLEKASKTEEPGPAHPFPVSPEGKAQGLAATLQPPKVGAGSSSHCAKEGIAWLTIDKVYAAAVRTRCKTWTCLGCRETNRNRIMDRMQFGLSQLGTCFFITVTLRTVGKASGNGYMIRDARYVAKVWRALTYRLKRHYPLIQWFRIVEVTKKGQPHLHLLVGGLTGTKIEIWRTWRELYRKSTGGDSYVVDVRHVLSQGGLAGYLAKYLVKNALVWEKLLRLGFSRRWTSSRGWPRFETRLRACVDDRVSSVRYEAGSPKEDAMEMVRISSRNPVLEVIADSIEGQRFLTDKNRRYAVWKLRSAHVNPDVHQEGRADRPCPGKRQSDLRPDYALGVYNQ